MIFYWRSCQARNVVQITAYYLHQMTLQSFYQRAMVRKRINYHNQTEKKQNDRLTHFAFCELWGAFLNWWNRLSVVYVWLFICTCDCIWLQSYDYKSALLFASGLQTPISIKENERINNQFRQSITWIGSIKLLTPAEYVDDFRPGNFRTSKHVWQRNN